VADPKAAAADLAGAGASAGVEKGLGKQLASEVITKVTSKAIDTAVDTGRRGTPDPPSASAAPSTNSAAPAYELATGLPKRKRTLEEDRFYELAVWPYSGVLAVPECLPRYRATVVGGIAL
jgi:hypothetical protein